MSIEEIIRAWKAGKQDKLDQPIPENPVGYPLSDEDLKYAVGGYGNDECPQGQATVGTFTFSVSCVNCHKNGQ